MTADHPSDIVEQVVAFDARIDYDDDLHSDTEPERRENVDGRGDRGDGDREEEEDGKHQTDGEEERGARFEISDGEGDEEYRSRGKSARVLYIHGITESIDLPLLRSLFTPHGPLLAAHIPLAPHSRLPKGYAFVRMATAEDASRALEAVHGQVVAGRRVEVMRANRGGERVRRPYDGSSYRGGYNTRGRGGYGSNSSRNEGYNRQGYNNSTVEYRGRPAGSRDDYYGGRREYSPGPGPSRFTVRNDRPTRPDRLDRLDRVDRVDDRVDQRPSEYRPAPTDRYPRDYDRRRDPYDNPPPAHPYYPPPAPYYEDHRSAGPSYRSGPPPPRARDYPPHPAAYPPLDYERRPVAAAERERYPAVERERYAPPDRYAPPASHPYYPPPTAFAYRGAPRDDYPHPYDAHPPQRRFERKDSGPGPLSPPPRSYPQPPAPTTSTSSSSSAAAARNRSRSPPPPPRF